jgi:hypothetical protein
VHKVFNYWLARTHTLCANQQSKRIQPLNFGKEKEKMRKRIEWALVCLLLAMGLFACGTSKKQNNNDATLTSIAVTPANLSIAVVVSQQLTATGTYSDNSTQNITASVTWTSSDMGKALISSAGLATGVAAGTTTISATAGSITGATSLTVTQDLVTDTTWKASASASTGWTSANFDDSSWSNAIVQTYNWGVVTNYMPSTTAMYIWQGSNQAPQTFEAYVRRTFILSATPGTATLYIFVDDGYELYINGTLVRSNAFSWLSGVADSVDIKAYLTSGTNVIAIHGMNTGGYVAMVLADLRL